MVNGSIGDGAGQEWWRPEPATLLSGGDQLPVDQRRVGVTRKNPLYILGRSHLIAEQLTQALPVCGTGFFPF